jgi:hypothetical protein
MGIILDDQHKLKEAWRVKKKSLGHFLLLNQGKLEAAMEMNQNSLPIPRRLSEKISQTSP